MAAIDARTFSPAGERDAGLRIVEPCGGGGWRVVAPGSTRASGVFDTRREAERRAGQILARRGGGIVDVRDPAGESRRYAVSPPKPIAHLYREPRAQRYSSRNLKP
jgi:hypothetical protein